MIREFAPAASRNKEKNLPPSLEANSLLQESAHLGRNLSGECDLS